MKIANLRMVKPGSIIATVLVAQLVINLIKLIIIGILRNMAN